MRLSGLSVTLDYEANAPVVSFTNGKEIKITHDYGEGRYNSLVVDLTADDLDVAKRAMEIATRQKILFFLEIGSETVFFF